MKLLALFFSVFYSFFAFSQEAEVVVLSSAGNEEARKVLSIPDGYYVLGVAPALDASGSHVVIQKVSLSLNCVWTKKILLTQANSLEDAVLDSEGNIFITGMAYQEGDYNVYVAKFDTDGDLINIGLYGSPDFWESSTCLLIQENTLVVGGWTFEHPMGFKSAMVLEVSTNLEWQSTFISNNESVSTELIDVAKDETGGILFIGNRGEVINNNLWFAEWTEEGLQTKWIDATYSNWFAASLFFDGASWLVGCNRNNPSGDWDWLALRYDLNGVYLCGYDASTTHDYHVVQVLGGEKTFMIGYQFEYGLGEGDIMLQQINEDCSWLAAMSYGDPKSDIAADAVYDILNRIVMVGARERADGTTDMVLIRWNLPELLVDYTFSTDILACQSIVATMDLESENFGPYIVENTLYSEHTTSFVVLDLMGRKVLDWSEESTSFDLSTLPTGIYLFLDKKSGVSYKLFR